MTRKISFSTYLQKTPKKKVIKYLHDRHTSRVHLGMSKDRIYYVLDSYGYIRGIEQELNLYWNTGNAPPEFMKYGIE